jgi:DNA replication protein DnaC
MYYKATFENFIAESEELRRNKRAVKRFCDEKREGKLFLIGGCGTGKTHLACAAVRRFRGVIYTMFEIVSLLKAAYNNTAGGAYTEDDVLGRLSQANLLAVDEIGRTKGSEWEASCLSHIVNTRHENYLPTLFISNGHFKNECDKRGCEKCLENYLDDNILSRISENVEFLRFYGTDFRRTKNRGTKEKGV